MNSSSVHWLYVCMCVCVRRSTAKWAGESECILMSAQCDVNLILHELQSQGTPLRVFLYFPPHLLALSNLFSSVLWLIGCLSGHVFDLYTASIYLTGNLQEFHTLLFPPAVVLSQRDFSLKDSFMAKISPKLIWLNLTWISWLFQLVFQCRCLHLYAYA